MSESVGRNGKTIPSLEERVDAVKPDKGLGKSDSIVIEQARRGAFRPASSHKWRVARTDNPIPQSISYVQIV